MARVFDSGWEPTLLESEVLATGRCWYDGTVEYDAQLKRERFDYSSKDLEQLEIDLDPINLDYVDLAVNEHGERFVWYFSGLGTRSSSISLASLEEAREHIKVYGEAQIQWQDGARPSGAS